MKTLKYLRRCLALGIVFIVVMLVCMMFMWVMFGLPFGIVWLLTGSDWPLVVGLVLAVIAGIGMAADVAMDS